MDTADSVEGGSGPGAEGAISKWLWALILLMLVALFGVTWWMCIGSDIGTDNIAIISDIPDPRLLPLELPKLEGGELQSLSERNLVRLQGT